MGGLNIQETWQIVEERTIKTYGDDEDFLSYARGIWRRPNSVILLSGGSHDAAGYSIACWNPAVVYEAKNSSAIITVGSNRRLVTGNAVAFFDRLIQGFRAGYELQKDLPFMGGGVGFIAYETKNYIEVLPQTAMDDICLPDMWLIWPLEILIHNRKKGVISYIRLQYDGINAPRPEAIRSVRESPVNLSVGRLSSNFSRNSYIRAVRKIIEYIRDGHVYQVNLSQRFSAPIMCNPFELWVRLYKRNPAPFYAFVNGGRFQILCTSMERFLYMREGIIETRPIKGTRPRGKTPEQDKANYMALLNSSKDDAELSMIVDLLRNDLGKICKIGTVSVDEHKRIEEYQNVFHLVSIIRGKVRGGITYGDIIRATFPGGSITGCPKIRSMEIIDELEPHVRHVYTGSIGYWGLHGNMDLNIAIRTMIISNRRAYLSVGGGVVYDSDPVLEYEETIHKGRTFFEVLEGLDDPGNFQKECVQR